METVKLNYKQTGEGRPLIILHGLFGSLDNWQTHAKKLGEYYTVYLVDERNHGHSPHTTKHTYDLMVEDLRELMDDLQLDDAILIGHSMGGKTVMRFAQLYPNRVSKLVVVDMGVKQYPMHHDAILTGLCSLDFNQLTSRSEADQVLATYVDNFAVRQFLLKNLYWIEKGKLAWRMNLSVLKEQMEEILKPLPELESFVLTRFIKGELSNYILDEDVDQLEAYFPDSDVISISGAGHWVHSEQPDVFVNAVLEFCLR
jgi:esterase